jgi:hypothetical protein
MMRTARKTRTPTTQIAPFGTSTAACEEEIIIGEMLSGFIVVTIYTILVKIILQLRWKKNRRRSSNFFPLRIQCFLS